MTQSPVLPSQALLHQNSECGPSGSTPGSRLLDVPGQGRVQKGRCWGGPGALGTIHGEPGPNTQPLPPCFRADEEGGGWARAKDKKKPRDSETQDQKAGRTPPSSSGQTAADMGSKHLVPSSLPGRNESGIWESEGLGKLRLSAFSREGSRLSGLYLEKVFKEVIRLK